jgi:hypothetical protein
LAGVFFFFVIYTELGYIGGAGFQGGGQDGIIWEPGEARAEEKNAFGHWFFFHLLCHESYKKRKSENWDLGLFFFIMFFAYLIPRFEIWLDLVTLSMIVCFIYSISSSVGSSFFGSSFIYRVYMYWQLFGFSLEFRVYCFATAWDLSSLW